MNPLDLYGERMKLKGAARREASHNRVMDFIGRKLPQSLSFVQADFDGTLQSVAIIDTGKSFIKEIHCLPGERLRCGAVLFWEGMHWLITEVDARDEIYTSGMLRQCNYELKWFNGKNEIVSRHCVIEDGTKYLVGEREEHMMAIGDARIALIIGKDKETVGINRGKRFLIDDPDSSQPLAFEVTKPNKLFGLYNGEGVYKHILSECNATDDDNFDLMVADYYLHRPGERPITPPGNEKPPADGWL